MVFIKAAFNNNICDANMNSYRYCSDHVTFRAAVFIVANKREIQKREENERIKNNLAKLNILRTWKNVEREKETEGIKTNNNTKQTEVLHNTIMLSNNRMMFCCCCCCCFHFDAFSYSRLFPLYLLFLSLWCSAIFHLYFYGFWPLFYLSSRF